MTILALPFACSAAVLACSFLDFRPLVMAYCLPVVVGGCWVFA
jgi:hypothetical protein